MSEIILLTSEENHTELDLLFYSLYKEIRKSIFTWNHMLMTKVGWKTYYFWGKKMLDSL